MTTKRLPTRHERRLQAQHLTTEPIAVLPEKPPRVTCNRCLGLGISTERKRIEKQWQTVDCVCPQCDGTGVVDLPR
jgi:hypothetical protein